MNYEQAYRVWKVRKRDEAASTDLTEPVMAMVTERERRRAARWWKPEVNLQIWADHALVRGALAGAAAILGLIRLILSFGVVLQS